MAILLRNTPTLYASVLWRGLLRSCDEVLLILWGHENQKTETIWPFPSCLGLAPLPGQKSEQDQLRSFLKPICVFDAPWEVLPSPYFQSRLLISCGIAVLPAVSQVREEALRPFSRDGLGEGNATVTSWQQGSGEGSEEKVS